MPISKEVMAEFRQEFGKHTDEEIGLYFEIIEKFALEFTTVYENFMKAQVMPFMMRVLTADKLIGMFAEKLQQQAIAEGVLDAESEK